MMDVVDAFCWSPSIQNDGLRESLVNVTKWMDAAVENKEELLKGLIHHQQLIRRLLADSKFTYEQLYEGAKEALDKTEMVTKGIKKASSIAGGVFIDWGKRAVGGTLVIAGLPDLRPLILVSAREV